MMFFLYSYLERGYNTRLSSGRGYVYSNHSYGIAADFNWLRPDQKRVT